MPRERASCCDCLIVGAGPAGAALAVLLARRGFHVVLIAGDPRPASPRETLLPAALQGLDRCGLGAAVRAAATADRGRHGARWDREEIVVQASGPAGLCVRRPDLEQELVRLAVLEGARCVRGRVPTLCSFRSGERVAVVGADGRVLDFRPREVAVCAGRRLPQRLLPTRIVAVGARTAAFALRGRAGAGNSLVEATRDGWCWWIGGEPCSTAVLAVDADELRRHGRAAMQQRLCRDLLGPGRELGDAPIAAAVDATPRVVATAAPVFLVGDAAATLDPLASQGTEKALAAAEHAACAVVTALLEPALAEGARQCHGRFERELWQAHARTTAAFHDRVVRHAGEPFWQRRRSPPSLPRPSGLLVARDDLTSTTVLVRRGELLLPEAGYCGPGLEPASRIGRVAVEPLLRAFATPARPEDALALCGRDARLFALSPAAVLQAIEELHQRGWLRLATLPAAAGNP